MKELIVDLYFEVKSEEELLSNCRCNAGIDYTDTLIRTLLEGKDVTFYIREHEGYNSFIFDKIKYIEKILPNYICDIVYIPSSSYIQPWKKMMVSLSIKS